MKILHRRISISYLKNMFQYSIYKCNVKGWFKGVGQRIDVDYRSCCIELAYEYIKSIRFENANDSSGDA